jgi:tRNA(fMet)-specific endonuclease VapC
MHLLDTDTLTHLHAGHPRVVRHIQEVPDAEVGTTIISKIEILRGRQEFLLKATEADLLRAQALLMRSEERLAELLVVALDETAVTIFQRLGQTRGLKGIGRADLLIASIVLAHDATLVTRNLRHFRAVPRLRTTNWVD